MKNFYYSPVVDVHQLEQAQVICASDNLGSLDNYGSQSVWDFDELEVL